MTPLLSAVRVGDQLAVERAVDTGADLNEVDEHGRTALMHAILQGSIEIVRLLIKGGAGMDSADRDGFTALHFAAQESAFDAASALLEAGAWVDPKDKYSNTPLWRAVFNSRGRGDIISLLLKNGANQDCKNKSDVSPVELARRIGNYDVLRFFPVGGTEESGSRG